MIVRETGRLSTRHEREETPWIVDQDLLNSVFRHARIAELRDELHQHGGPSVAVVPIELAHVALV